MGHFSAAIEKLIFLLNLILVLIGVFLIYCGIVDEILPKELTQLKEFVNQLSFVSKIILGIGVIIFIVSFFGCWGTFIESTSFLSLYAIFLVVLIMLEASVGFYLHFNKDSVKNTVEEMFKNGMQKYHSDQHYKEMFDFMQNKWKCCGENGPKDWKESIPQSCCEVGIEKCKVDDSFQDGCLSKFLIFVNEQRVKILWIVVGAAAFKVLVILLTLLVRKSILESRRMEI